MEIWKYTLEELTGNVQPQSENPIDYVSLMIFDPESVQPLPDKPGYGTACGKGSSSRADQYLVKQVDGEWEDVGHGWVILFGLRRKSEAKGLQENSHSAAFSIAKTYRFPSLSLRVG